MDPYNPLRYNYTCTATYVRLLTLTSDDVTALFSLDNMCTTNDCTISPKKYSMCVIQSIFHSTIVYACAITVLKYVCYG